MESIQGTTLFTLAGRAVGKRQRRLSQAVQLAMQQRSSRNISQSSDDHLRISDVGLLGESPWDIDILPLLTSTNNQAPFKFCRGGQLGKHGSQRGLKNGRIVKEKSSISFRDRYHV